MKTLTLDEAFRAASPGPIRHVNTVLLDSDSVIIAERVSLLNAPTEQQKANAALLAHCFNHMRELMDAATRLAEKVKRTNAIQHSGGDVQAEDWSELYSLEQECSAILTKSNTVTLPE